MECCNVIARSDSDEAIPCHEEIASLAARNDKKTASFLTGS